MDEVGFTAELEMDGIGTHTTCVCGWGGEKQCLQGLMLHLGCGWGRSRIHSATRNGWDRGSYYICGGWVGWGEVGFTMAHTTFGVRVGKK